MKYFLAFLYSLSLLTVSSSHKVNAAELNAKCLLVINGVTKLDDRCSFKSYSDHDFLSDERMLITCPNGQNAEDTFCYGYQQRVTRQGVFAYLYRDNGVGSLCWNQGTSRKADWCFEGLRRDGACWSNSSARHRSNPNRVSSVKLCAWAL